MAVTVAVILSPNLAVPAGSSWPPGVVAWRVMEAVSVCTGGGAPEQVTPGMQPGLVGPVLVEPTMTSNDPPPYPSIVPHPVSPMALKGMVAQNAAECTPGERLVTPWESK